jgi:hypothetical protein
MSVDRIHRFSDVEPYVLALIMGAAPKKVRKCTYCRCPIDRHLYPFIRRRSYTFFLTA